MAAYSYMALVPIIQPPIMRALTTENERKIRMKKSRKVSPLEKLLFPIVATIVIVLLVPQSAALISMFMLGNLFRESKVVDRLTDTVQNSLMNIVTIFLGIAVGATMSAETFLRRDVIFIFFLGLFAFMIGTANGHPFGEGHEFVYRGQNQSPRGGCRGFGGPDWPRASSTKWGPKRTRRITY